MKILVVQFLLTLALTLTSSANLITPEAVLEAFRQKYPDVPEPIWELDTNGSYEANYRVDGIKYRADFTKEGIWTETENNIDFNELPPEVRTAYLLKYSSEDFRDAEAVDSAVQGKFYEIELVSGTSKIDVMFDEKGKILDPGVPTSEKGFFQFWMDQAAQDTPLIRQGWSLIYKVVFNLITIYLFAYVIYYRRHHDHKMLFLLLAFNLFLFPIFLSSSLVTAGFGFTIFALLALVRLRSEAFDKAEIAYLLGAISLTFVNTMMPAVADGFSAAIILLTAAFADRPSVWRDSFQKIEVDYKLADKALMLDQKYLREKLADEYQIDVREITINRVFKNEIRLTLMYRDVPELRKTIRSEVKKTPPKEDPFFY
ncbi:DUF4956 domain-containing protein [Akkermansiaceae bacterium]|nr:DUF4956 domain-containing protein [Akkermansiaceae bacterium]